MRKGPKRPGKAVRTPNKTLSRDAVPFNKDDMDDEIDAFHKQRDVIPLDANDDAEVDSDEDLELPVFDFEGVDDDNSDDGRSDDDEGVFNDTEIAKMERQAKYMERIGGGEDEMSDDSEQEEERKAVWGRKKSFYYDADNVDYELQSSDEERPMEEEAETVKMQRERANSLKMEDFGLEDTDRDGSDPNKHEKTIQDILDGKQTMKEKRKPDVDGILEGTPYESYEEIKKDINALSKDEQMDALHSSSPELVGLLTELNEALNQLQKVKPLLVKVRESKDVAKGGMHYLEVKHILLLTYCQAIGFYLLLKSEGHPVRDHPVIARLVEIKNLFEKMKQIDTYLPSQIEELLNHNPVTNSQDKLVNNSVLSEHIPDMTEVSTKPFVATVSEAAQLVSDFSKNYQSQTASQKDQVVQVGLQSMEMLKVKANLEAKLKQKGLYNLMNLKLERTQNHALTPVNRRLETLNDFDDEVQQTAAPHVMKKVPTSSLHSDKVSQLVATKVNKAKFVSGDDDLPKRDDIGERRRKHELRVLARAGAESMDIDVQEDGEKLDSEDEFYKQVKKQRSEKLKAKEELYSRTPFVPPPSETEADGKRLITYQIEKNRGLTRRRKKETKTPRKKYRVKYQDAQIRRKGQVRDIRKPSGPYGGESTGINTSISRSTRFKS